MKKRCYARANEEDDREGFQVKSPVISAMCKSSDDRAAAEFGVCKKAPVKRKKELYPTLQLREHQRMLSQNFW